MVTGRLPRSAGTEHARGNDPDDRWKPQAGGRALLGNKSGATRLGFAVLLKLFQADGRFPRRPEDVPLAAAEAVASQIGVSAASWRGYPWQGRTIEYHRAQIRAALGFREATDDDAAALGGGLGRRPWAAGSGSRFSPWSAGTTGWSWPRASGAGR